MNKKRREISMKCADRKGQPLPFLVLLAALVLATGCSSKKEGKDKDSTGVSGEPSKDRPPGGQAENSVSGSVTLDGKPVLGMVIFVGADDKELPASPISSEGNYFLDHPPPGKYKVVVR